MRLLHKSSDDHCWSASIESWGVRQKVFYMAIEARNWHLIAQTNVFTRQKMTWLQAHIHVFDLSKSRIPSSNPEFELGRPFLEVSLSNVLLIYIIRF
ncbi:hypothetical protein RCIA114 [Methanocella arvoryzae MRE50]|uniref:Uncharacterized protein n=1 Tax=Methanocella arvoryzae (strain DSM 22066 / NBRC 105507 / MRE50) TaxID=351160 RepID=Q0W4G1_METAR|nr:hypothetical protein RCIA114 [Methanocella arvoryzae MRE50]